jgi:hypothetical protein
LGRGSDSGVVVIASFTRFSRLRSRSAVRLRRASSRPPSSDYHPDLFPSQNDATLIDLSILSISSSFSIGSLARRLASQESPHETLTEPRPISDLVVRIVSGERVEMRSEEGELLSVMRRRVGREREEFEGEGQEGELRLRRLNQEEGQEGNCMSLADHA